MTGFKPTARNRTVFFLESLKINLELKTIFKVSSNLIQILSPFDIFFFATFTEKNSIRKTHKENKLCIKSLEV